LYFGFKTINHFEEHTSFPIPELEGWWTIFVKENNDIIKPYNYINFMIHLSRGRIGEDGKLYFFGTFYPNPPEALDGGRLICEIEQIATIEELKCSFSMPLITHYFYLNLASISSDRIYGESPTGDTLEMIRLSNNFCISPSTPEYCVNTGTFDYLND